MWHSHGSTTSHFITLSRCLPIHFFFMMISEVLEASTPLRGGYLALLILSWLFFLTSFFFSFSSQNHSVVFVSAITWQGCRGRGMLFQCSLTMTMINKASVWPALILTCVLMPLKSPESLTMSEEKQFGSEVLNLLFCKISLNLHWSPEIYQMITYSMSPIGSNNFLLQ